MKISPSVGPTLPRLSVAIFRFLALVGILTTPFAIRAQQPAPSSHHDHAAMSMDASLTPAQQAKLLADKHESEFNHHLAGFFLVLAGLVILAEPLSRGQIAVGKYALPICFLISGLFLLVFSDTELWPFGPKPWIQGIFTNLEVLQHKTFALLLFVLGGIELARARRLLTAAWSAWVFPIVALTGAVLLLFHSHEGGMQGPDPMATMERIQMQHYSYAGTGLAIGLSKGLAEVHNRWQSAFTKLYPALMIVLGILLMGYVE